MKIKLIVLSLFFVLSDVAFSQQSVVIQTNSRDEVIHLIDTSTQENRWSD